MGDPQDREVALAAGAVARADQPSTSSSIATAWIALEHLELLAQGSLEPVTLELGRAQAEDQRAQLVERLARERA